MMKSEFQTRTDAFRYDEPCIPSLPSSAIPSRVLDEFSKLKTDNARLQRLVAELLVENQKLRQQFCGSRRDAEYAETSTTPTSVAATTEDRSQGVSIRREAGNYSLIWRIAAKPL